VSKSLSIVRVRFAPSPTGYLHVGGLRTALYNYLFARQHQGAFILRIEDTDRARFVEGAVDNLLHTLRWAGLDFDEGPGKEGSAGPYVQSERLAVYRRYAMELLERGQAYYAFDTAEELETMRKERERLRLPPKYDRRALRLSPDEIRDRLESGRPHVIRMKAPEGESVVFDDLVRGRVEFSSDLLDDQVLLKSDGYPTYHLANVVDDRLMGITHVIRGEEWLSSTPKHVLLYRYFGWEPPAFAHLPLLLNPDKSKLSKRQGDVAVEDYRRKGFLPEALVNFVALLGWNPGDERELFTLAELVRDFSLARVGKSGAVFNIEKLSWLNAQHLRRKSDTELLDLVREELRGIADPPPTPDEQSLLEIIRLMRDRATVVGDFVEKCRYLYEPPSHYDEEGLKKRWKAGSVDHLRLLAGTFLALTDESTKGFEEGLRRTAESVGVKPADLIHPLRLAVSGTTGGPGLYEILALLGKEEVHRRIEAAIERIHQ
jgi:glutamyl-tRNA synthetase